MNTFNAGEIRATGTLTADFAKTSPISLRYSSLWPRPQHSNDIYMRCDLSATKSWESWLLSREEHIHSQSVIIRPELIDLGNLQRAMSTAKNSA